VDNLALVEEEANFYKNLQKYVAKSVTAQDVLETTKLDPNAFWLLGKTDEEKKTFFKAINSLFYSLEDDQVVENQRWLIKKSIEELSIEERFGLLPLYYFAEKLGEQSLILGQRLVIALGSLEVLPNFSNCEERFGKLQDVYDFSDIVLVAVLYEDSETMLRVLNSPGAVGEIFQEVVNVRTSCVIRMFADNGETIH